MCSVRQNQNRATRWETNFGPREWLAVSAILAGIVGQWYTMRTRLGYVEASIRTLEQKVDAQVADRWRGADQDRYSSQRDQQIAQIEGRLDRLEHKDEQHGNR